MDSLSGKWIISLTLVLLAGLVVSFVIDFDVNFPENEEEFRNYYLQGKAITGVGLVLILAMLMSFFLFKREEEKEILYLFPAVLAASFWSAFLLSFSISLLVKFLGDEEFSSSWVYVKIFLQGSTSLFFVVGLVISIAPFSLFFTKNSMAVDRPHHARSTLSIPPTPSTISQAPSPEPSPIASGGQYAVMDRYKQVNEYHRKKTPKVVLAEDDILHATFLLDFFESFGLPCIHVATAQAALGAIEKHEKDIQLLLTDNYLRMGGEDELKTGSQLLYSLAEKYGRERNFRIFIMSGLSVDEEVKPFSDAAFDKPLNMGELQEHLKKWNIL